MNVLLTEQIKTFCLNNSGCYFFATISELNKHEKTERFKFTYIKQLQNIPQYMKYVCVNTESQKNELEELIQKCKSVSNPVG